MFTRKDYMEKKCTHREYYGQFVTSTIKSSVVGSIGLDTLLASKDDHLNDIPLKLWDNTFAYIPYYLIRKAGDAGAQCLSNKVYVLKEAARQVIEEYLEILDQKADNIEAY